MIRKLYLSTNIAIRQAWLHLLHEQGIKAEATIEETFGYYADDVLIGTASRYQNVIKCVAIDSEYQGGSVFNELISFLMNCNVEAGYFKHYVYTKPSSQLAFAYLGFKEIERVEDTLVFMEKAVSGFDQFIKKLEQYNQDKHPAAAIVMNANPFTLGHQFLVEMAAKQSEKLFVFVLSEEMSAFSSTQRMQLVREGTQHLHNVIVLPTDNYMVSNTTFPSYFLKENVDVTRTQARLDARVFANHIAPALSITKRFVGDEPFSVATSIYNEALQQEFKQKLALIIIERLENSQSVISATTVRKYLATNQIEATRDYVPESTYAFFLTKEGHDVIEKLKGATHEHP